jgi:hypothetical protein
MDSESTSQARFYRLREPRPGSPLDLLGRIDVAPEDGFNIGPAPKCSECGRLLGMLSWLPPFRLEIETWGRHFGDLARTGDELVVSQRFVEVFQKHGLRGIDHFEPVEVVRVICHGVKLQMPPPQYFKATIVRSSTTIDQEASGYVWENESNRCQVCLFDTLKRYRSTIVNITTWTGDDIFYPRGGYGPLVSSRFKAIFTEDGLYGAAFVPAEEEGYDFFPWELQGSP